MLNTNILLKRLAHIKQLFNIGIEQSYQTESIAVFSLLAFHDSVEMFLKLLSEHKGINPSRYNFLDYWTNIPDLTLIESMRNLNSRRVNLKHRGLLPAKSEIEISRVNTIDFFEQNTLTQFGIDFKDVSLIELVNFEKVKNYLETSQKELDSGNNESCVVNTAYAFEELLHTYEGNKSHWGTSPFFLGEDMSFYSSFLMGFSTSDLPKEFMELGKFIDKVKESIEALQKAVKIISFGFDYKEFVKFNILTPIVIRYIGGNLSAQIMGRRNLTKNNCQYCIDFVIKSALKLQEFDFDISSLDTKTDFEIKPIYDE